MAKRSKQRKSSKLTPPKRRLSSKDFLESAEKLWRAGPEVRYRNPDAWRDHRLDISDVSSSRQDADAEETRFNRDK
jgi:hypothetical protein